MIKSKSFFIPINSNSLAHYFGRGLILPSKYFSNKLNDIQDRFKDSILLCKEKWVTNTDCSVEIILTDDEAETLVGLSENFFKYCSPIPISRVRCIYFLNQEQSRTTLWNINNGAAFIPEKLIQVEIDRNIAFVSYNNLNDNSETKEGADLVKKVKYFDHLLGGLAFMRLGGESYMNYSENYFSTLSYFNKLIKEECKKVETEIGIKFSDKYNGVFSKNEGTWAKWQSYFYQNVEPTDVENVASQEGIKINKKLGVLQLDSINSKSIVYDIAVLATYGERKNKSIDNFISDLANGNIPNEKREQVSLIMGLNNGYSKFRNRYRLKDFEKSVKFELDSRLDYYTIESVYQFVFNANRENYNFSYLDEWVPLAMEKSRVTGTYIIIDKVVIPKKKPQLFSQEYLEDFLGNNSPKEIYSSIVQSISQWIPPFTTNKEGEGEKYFEEVLRKPITGWWRTFVNKLKSDFESGLKEQRDELMQKFEEERSLLSNKIDLLNEEINQFKNKKTEVITSPLSEATEDASWKDIKSNTESEDQKNIAKDDPDKNINYSLMDVKELKRMAKEKGIKPMPQKKEELIKAIKSVKTFL